MVARFFGGDLHEAARLSLHNWQLGARALDDAWLYDAQGILEGVLAADHMVERLDQPAPGRGRRSEWTWVLDEDFAPLLDGIEFIAHERHKPTDPRAAYAGTIDMVEYPISDGAGPVVVTDFKTGLAWITEADIALDPQANAYAFAVLQRFPDQPQVIWETWQLRSQRIVRHEFVAGEPWQARARMVLAAKRARVNAAQEARSWPAQVGLSCQYCPITGTCGALAEAINADVTVDDDPLDTVRRAVALKPIAAQLDRKAKALAKGETFVLEPGKAYGYYTNQRQALTLPVGDVVRSVVDLGASREQVNATFPGDRVSRGALSRLLHQLVQPAGEVDDPDEELTQFYELRDYQTVGVHAADTPPF
jgi:hypothetical protein